MARNSVQFNTYIRIKDKAIWKIKLTTKQN